MSYKNRKTHTDKLFIINTAIFHDKLEMVIFISLGPKVFLWVAVYM